MKQSSSYQALVFVVILAIGANVVLALHRFHLMSRRFRSLLCRPLSPTLLLQQSRLQISGIRRGATAISTSMATAWP